MGIFKAYDIRGIYPGELDEEIAKGIGKALVTFLKMPAVMVGRDIRLSSDSLFTALASGITESGADVWDIGRVSSPMAYFASHHLKAPALVMITASHNPKEYNGFKLARENSIPISGETGIKEIEHIFNTCSFIPSGKKKGKITRMDATPAYVKHVFSFVGLKTIEKNLREKKIAIDAGNGMGSLETSFILRRLPCHLVELNTNLNGSFPSHEPNPLEEKNTMELQKKVLQGGADLGISFDGDADRVFFIDERGRRISSDIITCLIAKEELQAHPGASIIFDVRSSRAVKETIEEAEGKPVMTRVGHAFLKEKMRKTDGVFGGEFSGHFYFKENFFSDSGIIAALKVIEVLCRSEKPFSQLVHPFQRYVSSGEINLTVSNKETIMGSLKNHYSNGKVVTLDGIRVDYPDWWLIVRPSNTEPLLRVSIEAATSEMMEKKKKEVLNIIGGN